MSFGLASETVEMQLLFQVIGLGAVWKQLCFQLLDGNVRLKIYLDLVISKSSPHKIRYSGLEKKALGQQWK